jgi:hypothetical protein
MSDMPPMQRTPGSIKLDGFLYTCAAMLPPAITFSQGAEVITTRGLVALALSCTLAGVIALKTFRSQSYTPSPPPIEPPIPQEAQLP